MNPVLSRAVYTYVRAVLAGMWSQRLHVLMTCPKQRVKWIIFPPVKLPWCPDHWTFSQLSYYVCASRGVDMNKIVIDQHCSLIQIKYIYCTVVVESQLLPVALCRSHTMFAASSPTMSSPLYCSSRSAAAIRWSTSDCWRTSECAAPASPTDKLTPDSCRGTLHFD